MLVAFRRAEHRRQLRGIVNRHGGVAADGGVDVASISTDEVTPGVTCDQEVWMQDRIRTAIRMSRAIDDARRVGADSRQVEDAIDGLVNGTAVEIINHLGLTTEGENLRLRGDRDDHLTDPDN